LTAIRVAVENLRGELPGEVRRAQADAAAAELVRLTRLFESILDMARIEADAVDVQREWVTAADVVDAAMAHVRHAIDGHALRVDVDDEHAVNIDARLASIALAHLLENAARYSPADREIVVDARTESEGLTATVTDHGPGLDPGELERVFERFYRGRGAQQATPGTGMGLAITRGLLNAIGGRVWAENAPGAGARFSIHVPGAIRSVAKQA
jgi:two-component system sensor histidine kinase KdpD